MPAPRWLLACLLVLAAACAGKAKGGPPTPVETVEPKPGGRAFEACDPLAPITTPFGLDVERIVAAGRAADASVYVVYAEERLFVGDDEGVVEQACTVAKAEGELLFYWSNDDGVSLTLELLEEATGTRLALARGALTGKERDLREWEGLSALDPRQAAGLRAATAERFRVDFAGASSEGSELVVVAPQSAAGYDDFRVFFGAPSVLTERSATYGYDQNGYRYASITLDGSLADLIYAPTTAAPTDATSTLTLDGNTLPLTAGPVPMGTTYRCFAE